MKITASVKNQIGTANKMLYGQFIEHHHRQVYGGIFEPDSPLSDGDGFREDVIKALKDIKVPVIRWPGGCYVSAYDWKKGVGKNRIPAFDKAWRVEEPHTFGTDEFIKFCKKVGCEPYICTNAGTGDAEAMSDWVEYCNLRDEGVYAKERIANGNKEPYGVKYWSVGNENWGDWEMGSKDREEWGRFVRESAKMMLRVDPSLQISAASIVDLDWNLNLLKNAGKYLDWISIHGYWDFPGNDFTHADYDGVILRTGKDISDGINKVRAYLTAFDLQEQIKIAYDEWNLRAWYHPNIMNNVHRDGHYSYEEVIPPRDKNDINSTYTMADAVFSASFLNTCLKNCDIVGMACFSPICNTRGAIYVHKEGLVLRPTYYVFYLYANLLGDKVLGSWQEDVERYTGMDGRRQKTVDILDITVTEREDGVIAVAAVNKSATEYKDFELNIIDKALTEYRIHTLNGESVSSYNDVDGQEVQIKTSQWQKCKLKFTLAPHSVNVIELK